MKLSQWHNGKVKPVHVGSYQRFLSTSYSYWDGKQWGLHSNSPQEAEDRRYDRTIVNGVMWRGIVK